MTDEVWVTSTDLNEVRVTRAGMLKEARGYQSPQVAAVRDQDAAGVPVRVVEPADPRGTIVFFHGGGFVFGEPDTHESVARRLADLTGHRVVIVHYRRAPEHPFPAAVLDTDAVCEWLSDPAVAPAAGWGPLTVAGDSAGGNLALHAGVKFPQVWSRMVLVYPYLDPTHETYDHEIDAAFSLEESQWFWRLYLQGADPRDPAADPLQEPSFAGLPPTLVQLAERDILTPTGHLLVERLRTDGVMVDVAVFAGMPHGFWRRAEYPESEQALSAIATWLNASPLA